MHLKHYSRAAAHREKSKTKADKAKGVGALLWGQIGDQNDNPLLCLQPLRVTVSPADEMLTRWQALQLCASKTPLNSPNNPG